MLITEITPSLSDLIDGDIHNPTRERSNTLPSMMNRTQLIGNTSVDLKRSQGQINLYEASLAKMIKSEVILKPTSIPHSNMLNAKDYVFLGSTEMPLVSDMGMTLDDAGHLLMIKSHGRDLWSSLYHNTMKNREYDCYTLIEKTCMNRIRFDALYVNDEGKLIGKIKNCNTYYTISIEENTQTHTAEGKKSTVSLLFRETKDVTPQALSFTLADGKTMTFDIENEKLVLAKYEKNGKCHDYTLSKKTLKIPMFNTYNVMSAKRTRHCLQLEIVQGCDKKIVYIDPQHISLSQLSVSSPSHKPPQNFYTCIGADAHERCDSGQPFSAKRWGNFSSKRIPLLPIDNVRVHWKRMHTARGEKNYVKAMSHLAKTVDPGFRAMIASVRSITKPLKLDLKQNKDIPCVKKIGKRYGSLLHELPYSVLKQKSTAEGIAQLVKKLGAGDSLTLNNAGIISAFVGSARGGIPFQPAYFVGIVAAISKTHSITLSKTDGGAIRFSFMNKRGGFVTALAGTGQGWEKPLLHKAGIDFFTVLPAEANIILSFYQNRLEDFSFDVKEEDIPTLLDPDRVATEPPPLVKEVIDTLMINQTRERGGALSLEGRFMEFRAQLGTAYGDGNYLVAPRNGAGLMANGELIALSTIRKKTIAFNTQEIHQVEQDNTLKAIGFSADIVTECKVMPIIGTSIQGNDYYFPMPITENSKKINIFSTKNLLKTPFSRQDIIPGSKIHTANLKQLLEVYNALKDIQTSIDMSKLLNKLMVVDIVRDHQNHHTTFDKLMKFKTARMINKKISLPFEKKSTFLLDLDHLGEAVTHLKEIKQDLERKERNNMDKKLSHFFTAKYNLSTSAKETLENLRNELNSMVTDTTWVSERLQREKISQLQSSLIEFQKRSFYRLSSIEIKSVGEITKTKSSISNIIVNFIHKKTISYTKHLGEIVFEYGNDTETQPKKMTCNYQFI